MIKSKSKIEKQLIRKSNPLLTETIILAKRNPKWIEVASLLTLPRRKRKNINIEELKNCEGTVVVCGKVLSEGEISKKLKVCALSFSKKAEEKLIKSNCEISTIDEEIKKNREMKGVTVLK